MKADTQLFDPDLINLPPTEHRPVWLVTDHDETDTNYSAEEEEEQVTITIPNSTDTLLHAPSIPIQAPDQDHSHVTIPNGEHVGVG